MRCLHPRSVGFLSDGKTIAWSQKKASREYAFFQLPCSKCLECRLEYARQWAVRCVHEADMYEKNSFITLTYSDEKLRSSKLQYSDFQNFAKRLRDEIGYEPENRIGYFVTGEYGEQTKRPHWHAIIFNWRPTDLTKKYTSELGHEVYESANLTRLWGNGIAELGSVTFESAGYCARYATKKLVHGYDQDHDYQPISKKSSRQAIGKKFLEAYWQDIFNYGEVILRTKDGIVATTIPRYYEKWLLKHKPEEYQRYVTKVKSQKMSNAAEREAAIKLAEDHINWDRLDNGKPLQITRSEVRSALIQQKFNQLMKYLKGDI